MGLSLAGSSRKKRIGADPRNTQWANDTDRFGHQHMLRMGWKPGRGLGYSVEGAQQHVKVKHKVDSKGLGHKPAVDEQPHGLDVFQRILGKLNGEEDKTNRQLADVKKRQGLYLDFVPGGVLEGTVDKLLISKSGKAEPQKDLKDEKKSKDKHKSKDKKKDGSKKKSKSSSKKSESESECRKERRKEKKEARSAAKLEKQKKLAAKEISAVKAEAKAQTGIRATRARYIQMKRKATQDPQSLKEILMQ